MRAPSLLQILIVVLIIVLLFGARRLPDLARSVGKSLKIFKSEVSDLHSDDDATTSSAPPQSLPPSSTPPTTTAGGSVGRTDSAATPAEGGSTRER